MSENYSKTDLRHIAEELIEDLRECEDGTRSTTRLLLRDAGYDIDKFDVYDLLDIHDALFRAARANHITLDNVKTCLSISYKKQVKNHTNPARPDSGRIYFRID